MSRNTFVFLTPNEIDLIDARLKLLEERQATMQAAIERITREVAEQKTVTDSVLTFIAGIKAQLEAAQAELAQIGAASATLNQLADDLDAQQAALAAAVSENTEPPVEPPPAT